MAKGKVLKTVIDIAGEISPTLGKSLDVVGEKLDAVNMKAVVAGAAIGGIAVGTIALLGKAAGALISLGDEYNTALNDIAAKTGLANEELEEMADVLEEVYGSNYGESMEDVAAGISEVYKATGITGDALAEVTKDAYALSEVFDYDVSESARAAKAMMINFGITGEEAFGLIAAGAQNGLDYSGELIDSINEYSVQFAKLGFSADDMFNIFQAGADSGAWNLDKMGDAVKEFSIRSIDGSKTTVEAFTSLGLDAEEMMAIFAAGGEDAELAFQGVLAALMDMDDAVQRDAIGVMLFGTQWEDLGVEAMSSLLDVQNEAYNTADAMGQIQEVKYDNIGEAFEAIMRQAEVSLLPLATMLADAVMGIMPILERIISTIGPFVEDLAVMLMPVIEQLMDLLLPLLEQLLPPIMEFANGLLPVLVEVITEVFDCIAPLLPIIMDLVNSLLPLILSLVKALLPVIRTVLKVLSPILNVVMQLLNILLPPLIQLIDSLIPVIEFVAEAFASNLAGALNFITPLLTTVTNIIGGIVSALSNVISFITGVFTGDWEGAWNSLVEVFKGIFNLIPETAESVINAVIKVINKMIEGVNSAGQYIGVTIPLIPEVTLPKFATGGITDGLSIAGEDPRFPHEYIISLNPAYRAQNLSYWAEAGRMLGADASDFYLGGGGSSSGVTVEGITFAPNITINGHANKETIMAAIEDEYPEFIDMLEEYFMRRGVTVYA